MGKTCIFLLFGRVLETIFLLFYPSSLLAYYLAKSTRYHGWAIDLRRLIQIGSFFLCFSRTCSFYPLLSVFHKSSALVSISPPICDRHHPSLPCHNSSCCFGRLFFVLLFILNALKPDHISPSLLSLVYHSEPISWFLDVLSSNLPGIFLCCFPHKWSQRTQSLFIHFIKQNIHSP